MLEENSRRIKQQKSEKLSEKNLDLYLNVDKEAQKDNQDSMPKVNTPVIKLKSKIPVDEDFGL